MEGSIRRTLALAAAVALLGAAALAGVTYLGGSSTPADTPTVGDGTSTDGSTPSDGDPAPGEDSGSTDSDSDPGGTASDPSNDRGTSSWTPRADIPEMDESLTIAESPTVESVSDLDRTEVTVVTTQGYYPDDEVADLVAFTTDGTVIYHEAEYGVYFDVDPVRGTEFTVEYLASKHFNGSSVCDSVGARKCTRDVIRRVNLTTGESETIYSEVIPRFYSARQHDGDRLNDTHYVVGDIYNDSVFVLNTTSGEKVWEWRAEYDYSKETGGKWFDWTHLNDVEILPDGRIMASLRNQDSVVFLDPSKPPREALQENWTLGSDDDFSVLKKQHNPDYIPEARGGPAVLVGDSENDRAVEYRRVDGEWERTWNWTTEGLNWPRDADRLPNGNTLVVNTRGDEVLGVGPDDAVRWAVDVGMPYDVERLGTGDESAGGTAADRRGEAVGSLGDAGGPVEGRPLDGGLAWAGLGVTAAVLVALPACALSRRD